MAERALGIFTLLFLLTAGSSATAQQQPQDLPISLITTSQRLSAGQQQQIQQYVGYWTDELASGEPDRVFKAAGEDGKLIAPPAMRASSQIFRLAYSNAALPRLRTLVKDSNDLVASQAMLAISTLGTTDALEAAAEFADPDNEPRWNVRLTAARAVGSMLDRLQNADELNTTTINRIVRRIADAAEKETHELVLRRDFFALATARTEDARKRQLALFERMIDGLLQNDNQNDEQINDQVNVEQRLVTIIRMMSEFQNVLVDIDLPTSQLKEFSRNLAPQLGRIFSVALERWDASQGDGAARALFERAIHNSESLVTYIDGLVREPGASDKPTTALAENWRRNNRTEFQTQTQVWSEVLGRAPYAR